MTNITTGSDRWRIAIRRLIGGFAGAFVLIIAAGSVRAQVVIPSNTVTNTYAAKFICGVQPDLGITGVPDAQPGRYSSKINIHNNTGIRINFRKKFIRLIGSDGQVAVERPTDPQAKLIEFLDEDQAMEVVCRDIYQQLKINITPSAPPPYIEGFVVLEVFFPSIIFPPPVRPPDPLDVEGIYTYKDLPVSPAASGVSISVVVYPAKSNAHFLQ